MKPSKIVSRSLCLLVACLVAALAPNESRATVGNCSAGDAPSTHTGSTCQSVCVETGSELVCEMETLCPNSGGTGSQATAVFWKTSGRDVSIWGGCLGAGAGTKFCCVFDEGATSITTLELNGTDQADEVLSFRYTDATLGLLQLQAWDFDLLEAYIRGNAGGDTIWGSDADDSSSYKEYLYGQHGQDLIQAFDGHDFLSGGNADDWLEGGGGADKIWGGDGDDHLEGGEGNDALCDASGYTIACAQDGGNFMDGGAGIDQLWYDESENPNLPCPAIYLDPNSTAGSESDQCGDHNDYTTTELPGSCQTYITTAPARCEGAN